MILIADSGSTSARWALTGKEKTILKIVTKGMNPYFSDYAEIEAEITKVHEKLRNYKISKVILFGSGCNSTEKGMIAGGILKKIFRKSEIQVHSDLLGAAVALFGHGKGVAVIIGTGSNSGYYNGNDITWKTESLGYILGDEGSGAFIGKEFIRNLLYGNLPSNVEKDFFDTYGQGKMDILENVYKKSNPNRYLAGFTKFIRKHTGTEQIYNIVFSSFDLLAVNHLLKYDLNDDIRIGFSGSVAFHFKDILVRACEKHGLEIHSVIKSPIGNLCRFYASGKK